MSGTLAGQFKFVFLGQSFYFNANANLFNETECETAFRTLSNVEDVTCSRTSPTLVSGATYTINFLSFPTKPYENNIFNHDGNPPLSSFQCDTSLVTGGVSPACVLSDVNASPDIKGRFPLF